MTRIDLSRLSPEEKDVLIVALLERVAALEAKLNQPPKTPGNSSVPPSRGQKANRPPRPKAQAQGAGRDAGAGGRSRPSRRLSRARVRPLRHGRDGREPDGAPRLRSH